MLRNLIILGMLTLTTGFSQASTEIYNPKKISCTAIREEPGAPTFGFELVRTNNHTYRARYLAIPGNETEPPAIAAEIPDLKCRFLTSNRFFFQCSKIGASVESIQIEERKLHLLQNKIQKDLFREFRAVGSEVPGVFLVYRFAKADTCTLTP